MFCFHIAQFEREVTGERIRDKIAASKQKGFWMGGLAPLGYDVCDRRLVINAGEAAIVRHLYQRYMELGCVRLLKNELDGGGMVSKVRISKTGVTSGGKSFSRGALYELLSNPIYLGEIRHRRQRYPGRHQAIVDREIWENVQRHIGDHAVRKDASRTKTAPSLLAGKLFDESGEPLYAQGASKAGRRYRYYVSRTLVRNSPNSEQRGWRLPALELERVVIAAVRSIVHDKAAVLAAVHETESEFTSTERILSLLSTWGERLQSENEAGNAVAELLSSVQLSDQGMRFVLNLPFSMKGNEVGSDSAFRLSHFIPVRVQRRGVEMRIIIRGLEELARKADQALLKGIARARDWFHELATGRSRSLVEIAKREELPKRYVTKLIRLAFMDPGIVEAIAEGWTPPGANLQMLVDGRQSLPAHWEAQKQVFGRS